MAERPSLNDEIRELDADADDGRAQDPQAARKKAMDFLARRDYGRIELQRKLERAGFAADVAEQAADQLAAEGLQDDARFAESFIRARASRGKGPLMIRAELGQRGLDGAAVSAAFAAADIDWPALAREVREKKFGDDEPRDFSTRARQMRFLQYRGFDAEQVRAACGEHD